MKKRFVLKTTLAAIALFLIVSGYSAFASIPHMINYQGMLTDNSGNPLSGSYNLTFKIWTDTTGGSSLWTETQNGVQVTNGLFNVIMGKQTALNLAFDQQYWLEVGVGAETMPRIRFTSVGYAYRADTAGYAFAGPWGGNNTWIFLISEGADTTLRTGGRWGITRYGNVLYGNADSTHVNFGVTCTTGTSGQNYKYCTVGGGIANTANGLESTVGGGRQNNAIAENSTVGGGYNNIASGSTSTIGGGLQNRAGGMYGSIGGGYLNYTTNYSATVGGGYNNWANDSITTVGGGKFNIANGKYSTIGGGYYNFAAGDYSAILSGYADSITSSGDYSYLFGIKSKLTQDSTFMVDMPHIWFGKESNGYEFPTSRGTNGQVMQTDGSGKLSWANIGGAANSWTFLISDGADTTLRTGGRWGIARYGNTLYGNADSTHVNLGGSCITGTSGQNYKYCSVGGGLGNTASQSYTTIGGGKWNNASGEDATIGGGWGNTASGYLATVAGGQVNVASDQSATVGGGLQNNASGGYATVGGGFLNIASGSGGYATVSGGGENTAAGYCVTIGGGWGNKASADGATVGGGFSDTASNQDATIGGGALNTASGLVATIGGGELNTASGDHATVGGGYSNTASGYKGTICGGSRNLVDGDYSAILGGYADTITSTADYSFLFGIKSKLTDDSTFMVGMPYSRFDGDVQFNKNGGVLTLRTPTHDDGGRYGIYFANNNTAPFMGDDGEDQYFSFYTGFSSNRTYDAHITVFGSASGSWGKYIDMTHDGTDGKIITDAGDIALLPAGNVGIGTTTPGTKLAVYGLPSTSSYNNVKVNTATGDFYYQSSSKRYKEDVRPLEDDFHKILQVEPKSFMDKASGQREIGYIAEEFDGMGLNNLVIYDKEHQPDGLKYELVSLYLLEVVKELKTKNEELQRRIEVLEGK